MRYAAYGLVLLIGLTVQTAGSPGFVLFGSKPQIMLLLALLFAMINEPAEGTLFGFSCGLVQDLVAGHFVGLYAGTFMLLAALVGFLTKRLYKENFLVRFFAVLVGTAFGQILYLSGTASFGLSVAWPLGTWATILGTSVVNGVLGLLLYRPLASLNRRLIYWDELFKRTG